MTISEAQNRIQALLEGDTDAPEEGSEDWDTRLALINDAIEEWGSQADVKWQELYSVDTSKTGNGVLTSFDLPDDFDHSVGNIALLDNGNYTQIDTIPSSEAHLFLGNVSDQRAYIQGNQLVFTIAPGDGVTINIPYYRKPTELTDADDVIPMSKPRFVVYWTTAYIGQQSDDYARFNADMAKADDLMQQMKVDNESRGVGQANAVRDNYPGWGT